MIIPAPPGLSYLPFQEAGIRLLAPRVSTLLGDSMGLGKTIQAIGYINVHPEIQNVLVVCPAFLKINWAREMQKWLVNPLQNLVITNYDVLDRLDMSVMYDLCILDEGQYIKNPDAKRSRLCCPIRARRKLLLTGTPLLNRPVELWHLLHWLNPRRWPTASFMPFMVRYCNGHYGERGWEATGATNLDELNRELRGIMIRRLKEDVLTELPLKRRQIIELPLDGLTVELRNKILRVDQEMVDLEMRYASDVMKLETAVEVAWEKMSELRHEVGRAKAEMALELSKEALEAGEKLILFAHHRDVIDRLQVGLWGYHPATVHGDVTMIRRQEAVDRFQKDAHTRVFIGQIQAAGVGIDLTASSHVIFVEEDWTPGVMAQAEDRPHRIGQKESVLVQYLVLEKSLDARMIKSAYRKEKIINRVLNKPTERKENSMADVWIDLAERAVRAIESIANSLVMARPRKETGEPEKPVGCTRPPGCCEPKAEPDPATPAVPEEMKSQPSVDRESIKAELRNRGIKFKESARTETLEKQLAEARAAAAEVKTAETAAVEPPAVVTKDQVKTALIDLATVKGKDAAIEVIKTIGKAENISGIAEANYAAVLKASQEKMAAKLEVDPLA